MQKQSRPSRRNQWAATVAATAASTYAMDAFATVAGIALVASGFLAGGTPGQVLIFLILSYLAWAGGLKANLAMNSDLLARTGISASLLSKIAYEAVAARTRNLRVQRFAAGAGYVFTEILKEAPYYIGAISAAFVSDAVASAEVMLFLGGANFGAAAYELALARSTRSVLVRLPRTTASFDRDWDPRQYLQDYYTTLSPEEEKTIAFFVDRIGQGARGEPILFAGVGPTLHHVFLAAEHASEIHLAEYLPGNLDEIRDWLSGAATSHDWSFFLRHTLDCEGVVPTNEACKHRSDLTRAKITRLLPFDLRQPQPLGQTETYSTVISAFCADSATEDIHEWTVFMDRIAALVRPGGTLLIAALHDASGYRVGPHQFPSAKVSEQALRRQMRRAFPAENITVTRCPFPDTGRGFAGVLLAHGWGRL